MRSREEANLNLTSVLAEYEIVDQGLGLHNNKLRFSVQWNTMPVGGVLSWFVSNQGELVFPEHYRTPVKY